jgi:hypothetical protein
MEEYERRFRLEVTPRYPAVRTFNSWLPALIELYMRDRQADRFAIFQDDLVTYRNLRYCLDKISALWGHTDESPVSASARMAPCLLGVRRWGQHGEDVGCAGRSGNVHSSRTHRWRLRRGFWPGSKRAG